MMSFEKKTKPKKYIWRNSLIFTLCFCTLFSLYPVFSFATERESKSEETVGETDNKEESVSGNGTESDVDLSEDEEQQSQDEAAWQR